MSKVFNIVFLCFISFSALYSSEYKALLLSPELSPGRILAINDHEQALIITKDSKPFLYDKKTGLAFIETNCLHAHLYTLNNAGQILGLGYGPSDESKPFIWSKDVGVQWLDIFGSKYISTTDLNDLGQIIGSYTPVGEKPELVRPFTWKNGIATDMGPGSEFSKSIENLGYHVMEISLVSINNKGELAGYFSYGKFNAKTQKYILVGYESFYWNGNVHILPFKIRSLAMKVNNCGSVMVVSADYSHFLTNTYLWNLKNGVKIIENFEGKVLNDSNLILGTKPQHSSYLLWKDEKISTFEKLLGVENINHLAPRFSDTYEIEGLSEFLDMNNKGQIICRGLIWGDLYPCLLEPIDSSNCQ